MEVCDINLKDYIQSKEKDKAGGLISCFYESNVNEDFAGEEDHVTFEVSFMHSHKEIHHDLNP